METSTTLKYRTHSRIILHYKISVSRLYGVCMDFDIDKSIFVIFQNTRDIKQKAPISKELKRWDKCKENQK